MTDRRFGFHLLKSLSRDENGAVLPLVAVVLMVMIGGAAMALDISRLYTMQSALQKAADAAALAGAAELDGRTDATDRATTAIVTLMANKNRAEGQFVNVNPIDIDFFTNLPPPPATDADPLTPLVKPINPSVQATVKYVRVRTSSNLTTAFPLELVGMAGTTLRSGGEAVAGSTLVICEPVIMLMCQATTDINGTGVNLATATPGMMLKSKASGGQDAFGAGNFGWMDYNGNAAAVLNDLVGTVQPYGCIAKPNGMSARPGDPTGAKRALNTRFDLYENGTPTLDGGQTRTDPKYPPAKNVRKMYVPPSGGGGPGGAACNPEYDPSVTTTSFGGAVSPSGLSVQIPDDGNMGPYWAALGLTNPGLASDLVNSPTSEGVRYKSWKYEVADSTRTARKPAPPPAQTLSGAPACSSSAATVNASVPDYKRRTLVSAVVDCVNINLNGNATIGGVTGVAEFFMTRPMETNGPDDYLIAEFQNFRPANSGQKVTIAYITQLYR